MKKSNILIAVLAIIAAVTVARAETVIDFDKGSVRSVDFMGIKAGGCETNLPLPTFNPVETVNGKTSSRIFGLDTNGKEMLRQEILNQPVESLELCRPLNPNR